MITAGWHHTSLKAIRRSAGRSAVACAAYRTGTTMTDERYGTVRDFSRKRDVVTHFTLAPADAPAWAHDAERLWNAVEAKEPRVDSQLAFEWEIALPNELDAHAREAIARRFSQWLVDEYGVAVTTGIHEGGERGNGLNDHAHVLLTQRPVTADGWARTKLRDFNVRPGKPNPEVERVREQIATFINDALEDAGSETRVDHRSFETRGVQAEPTKHLGPAAMALERTGRDGGERAAMNREILEERLRWQMEQALPEITPEIDRELSARWEGWEPLARGVEAAGDAPPPLERGSPATTAEEHRGWRRFVDYARAFQAKAIEFWHDETSGTPEGERGFVARLFDTGVRLFAGLREREGPELAEGVEQSIALAADLLEKRGGEASDDSRPRGFAERVRDGAAALWRNERGMVPDEPFDRLAAQWQPEPQEPTGAAPPPEPEPPGRDGPDMA